MQIGLPFREADTDMSFDAIKQPMVDWAYGKDYFNADYIVTEDSHFNHLKQIPFPQLNVLTLDEFNETL